MPKVATGVPTVGDGLGGAQRTFKSQGGPGTPGYFGTVGTGVSTRSTAAGGEPGTPGFGFGTGVGTGAGTGVGTTDLSSIVSQYFGGGGTGITAARRNLGLSLDSAERSRVAASSISGITRAADLQAALGSASLRRDFLGEDIGQRRDFLRENTGQRSDFLREDIGQRRDFLAEDISQRRRYHAEDTSLLGRLRATEDRVGFRQHLSSVAGLAQGVQQRLRTDLQAGRALRDEQDRLTADRTLDSINRTESQSLRDIARTESQGVRGIALTDSQGARDIGRTESQGLRDIALTETRARDRDTASGEIQTIRDDLASADIAQRRTVGEANLADREDESSFSIGSLPTYDFFGG